MNTKSKIATAVTALALVASFTIPSSEAQAKKPGMGTGITAGQTGAAVVGVRGRSVSHPDFDWKTKKTKG